MTTTIGPDGLMDEERPSCDCKPGRSSGDKIHMPSCSLFHHLLLLVVSRLAAERLTHAETRAKHAEWSVNKERRHAEEKAMLRAQAEKAEAGRDRLRLDLDSYRTAREAFGKTVQGGARAHDAAAALMVERDRLRASLELVSLRQGPDGPCWCVFPIPNGKAHHITCLRARALLGEVKP
jgi:hypothetical protein